MHETLILIWNFLPFSYSILVPITYYDKVRFCPENSHYNGIPHTGTDGLDTEAAPDRYAQVDL